MTTRILLLIALACSMGAARAVDLRTLPSMNETKMSPDVELKGREVEAIEVALRQFRENRYSIAGDLKHFTVELRREGSKLLCRSYLRCTSQATTLHQPGTNMASSSHMLCHCAHSRSSVTTTSVTKSSNQSLQPTAGRSDE
jgi:hypothetical protein